MAKVPFFGGSGYYLDAPGTGTSALVNLYPEVIESQEGKAVGRLVGTPGLKLFTTLPASGCRCMWMGEGRLFVIYGSRLMEVYSDSSVSDYGDVGNDGQPAQIFVNGTEMLVISAGYAWRVYGLESGIVIDHIKLIAAEYSDLAIGVDAFYFDLVIDAVDDTKVSSRARPFTGDDVGKSLMITGGAGFATGTLTISAVGGGGVATLSGSAGTTGSSGGTGNLLNGDNTTVNSPTLPFSAWTDIGNTLVITGGSGWTLGTYTITAVTPEGVATLSGSPGDVGTTGGIGTQYPGESIATDASGNLKAATGTFLDGYGIVAPPIDPDQLTNVYYITSDTINYGFQKWVAIDKGVKEGYPDNILALLADHEDLWIFGDLQSTEVHRNTGAALFPFERDMSAYSHFGLAAQWSVVQLGRGVAWIAWTAGRGAPMAFFATGFQPQRVSDAPLEHIWATYPTVRDAIAYSYIEDGHHFWVISFPKANVTWCYDLTASQQMGKPMWHQRAWWDPAAQAWARHRGAFHAYGFWKAGHSAYDWQAPDKLIHFVGDWENGNLYVQDPTAYTDAGNPIRRERIFQHMPAENKRTFWHLFQLECEVGSEALTWTLDFAKDYGWTYGADSARDRSALANGKHAQRLRWLRLGSSFDRVWRLTTTSAARISITNAYFDATQGDA